jgi:hypothetical protein
MTCPGYCNFRESKRGTGSVHDRSADLFWVYMSFAMPDEEAIDNKAREDSKKKLHV